MKGHIKQRSKGSWALWVDLGRDPETGKRKQQTYTVRGSKKDAEKRLYELLHQLDTGTFIKPAKTTLAEYLEMWLKDYVRPNLAPRTAEGYEHIIHRHLIPVLGNMTLTQLKPEYIQRYYSEKLTGGRCDGRGGLSPKTVRHHHVTLHGALQSAVKWGLLGRNPADAVSPPRVQQQEMQTWGEDDIACFLEAAKDSPYYALFYTSLFTGMRRSELLALRWHDVDFILSQIYINRSLHHLRDGSIVFRLPKSAKGRRTVALPPSAILLLKEHYEKQKLERAMLGILLSADDLVFSYSDGKPILPDTVTHAWIKLVRRSGLKPIRLHDARHTHASLMLKQGVHPKIVQERLGHSSIQITLDTYSHVAPGLQQAAAEGFDKLLNRKAKNEAVEKFG